MTREIREMSETRRNIIVGGAAGLLAGGLARSVFAAPPVAQAHVHPPLLGNPKAEKRLVVWGSYTCPFTALLIGTLNGIVTDMPGVVNVEWRHFPTHPPDPALHVAGLGFKGQHFWGFTFHVLSTVYAANGQFSGLTSQKLAEFASFKEASTHAKSSSAGLKAGWPSEPAMSIRMGVMTRLPSGNNAHSVAVDAASGLAFMPISSATAPAGCATCAANGFNDAGVAVFAIR